MSNVTIGLGGALIALGVGGYLGTERTSVTALIPAFFGLVFLVLGVLARKDNLRKHAMHAAAALGLVGFLVPAVRATGKLIQMMNGEVVDKPVAVVMQTIMALLCAGFVALCVRSFIMARRSRAATPSAPSP